VRQVSSPSKRERLGARGDPQIEAWPHIARTHHHTASDLLRLVSLGFKLRNSGERHLQLRLQRLHLWTIVHSSGLLDARPSEFYSLPHPPAERREAQRATVRASADGLVGLVLLRTGLGLEACAVRL